MATTSRGGGDWHDFLDERIDLRSQRPVQMIPKLGNKFHTISKSNWWEAESVFVFEGKSHTRKNIILSAANKDGGAHVDPVLEKYYESLASGKMFLGITGNLTYEGPPPFKQGVLVYPDNAHLALLRQFGHEMLASAMNIPFVKDFK